MRLTMSPPEGLEMKSVGLYACSGQSAPEQVGPVLRAAHVDVSLGDVGDPEAKGVEVVDVSHPVAQPGFRVSAMAG